MKKSLFAKILAVLICLSLLAACGGSDGGSSTDAANEGAGAAAGNDTASDAGGSEGGTDGSDIVIAGIYKMGDAEWFIQEGEASRAVVESYGGTFMYMDAQQNAATYMELIDNCIAQNVNGILVCLPDQNLSQATLEKLEEAGIPVIAVDDPLQEEDGTLLAPWVGIDAYNIGAGVGEWAVGYITGNGLADDESFGIMLLTAETVSSIVPRTEGMLAKIEEGLPDFPDSRIFTADHDSSSEQGNTAASAVITGNPQISKWLVLGISDEGAVGAARALEAAGLEADSCVVGLGGYLAPEEFEKEDSPFRAAAYFSAGDVGGTAAEQLMQHILNGTAIPERYAVSATIVEPGDDLAAIMPEYVS